MRRGRSPSRSPSTSTPVPGEDILNVQANARLAAHLREEPAPHILEEDPEPTEELAGDDFTYSQETTTAFQELLTLIDSSTRELPSVLSPACENHARKMRTVFTRRLEPKTRSSYHIE